jgi:hypothetical protein
MISATLPTHPAKGERKNHDGIDEYHHFRDSIDSRVGRGYRVGERAATTVVAA